MDYNKVIQLREQANNVQKGAVIRKNYRADGYKNLLNKYGTTQDNSEAYFYEAEGRMPDMELTRQYETNGLFAKIVDTPADEALRTGFELGINDDEVKKRIMKKLIALDFDERCATAIKWARLYGGSIIVMMIDDGRELNQPVDWKNVKDIDELLVFERAIVMPDYTSLYQNYGEYFSKHTKSRFGMPKYYNVYSINGYFTVHESRCLVFKNGTMPQNTMIAEYRFWGIPEYLRIKRELKDTVTTHGNATKLLERSVQAVYKMKDLAQLLATDEGEDAALMRLQLIDMARGFLNTIAIDGEGEDYGFQSFTLSGVKEVVDTTCQMLSAITQIPQTILFGRSPAGMNSTGDSDLENYYNFVGRIRTQMIKHNLEKLIDIICIGEVNEGNMKNIPDFELEFLPLWSLTEEQQVNVDATKASTAQTKASTAQLYIEMGVLDPTEVRRGLMSAEDYKIETLIDENDEEDVLSPEERSALLQMKLQDEQGGSGDMAQMMAMQGGGEAMQGNVPMMPQNAENGQEMNAEDGGEGSGNFGHAGRVGKVGGSSTEGHEETVKERAEKRKAWNEECDKKLDEMAFEEPSEQARWLWEEGYLNQEDAITAMKDGTAKEHVQKYVEFLRKNGDPTPTKATTKENRNVTGYTDFEHNKDFMMEVTGYDEAKAKRAYDELHSFTSGATYEANTNVIDEFINHSPAYEGEIYRGMHFVEPEKYDEFMQAVKTGEIGMEYGNASWTSSKDVLRTYSHSMQDDINSVEIVCMKNRTSTPIEYATAMSGEYEVISNSKARWSVMRTEEWQTSSGGKKAVVYVVEKGEYAE